MSRRNHTFSTGEYYHCFNRGTDKRIVFSDAQDYAYFLRSIQTYRSPESFGKLRLSQTAKSNENIVEIVSYCLLPNHFHIVLKELHEHGISQFMKRVGVGYTLYFNAKYKRSGVLFQGPFKSKHIGTDQDLRQVLSYVTHNNVIHDIVDPVLYRSYLNSESEIINHWDCKEMNPAVMKEIAEIIKLQRLTFDAE